METVVKAKTIPERRIIKESECILTAKDFTQTIDVDLTLKEDTTKDLPNMPDYKVRSLQNAINYIHELKSKGINSVVIRMGSSVNNNENSVYSFDPLFIGTEEKYNNLYNPAIETPVYKFLEAQNKAYKLIRNEFPKGDLHIIGDPFGIAPNKNGGWGIQDENGQLDYDRTADIIKRIAKSYSESNLDGVLTLGRIYREVKLTREALDELKSQTKIYSFSQNIESKTAYIYLDNINNRRDTRQKIIPGNITEMALHTLLDIYEGTNVVVVKPTESFHAIYMTNQFITNKMSIVDFLNTDNVKRIILNNKNLSLILNDILENVDSFFENVCKNVKIATYTVSGSYYLQKLLEQAKGENFTYNVLAETFKNAKSSAGYKFTTIMDRNASWYLDRLKK
jgi:porphobilinogen synthase